MCEPTVLAVSSFAIGAAQAGLGYMGQQANYKQGMRTYNENAKSAAEALTHNYANSQLKMQQTRAATLNRATENSIEGMRARSTATVAAGEAGVAGLSVDRLMQDYYSREGRYQDNLEQNLEWDYANTKAGMESARSGAQNQINSVPRPQAPSYLDAGLRIVGAGVNAGSQYMAATRNRPAA